MAPPPPGVAAGTAAAAATAEDNAPPATPVRTNRNDYENPWESAANDRLWERDPTTTTTTTTNPMETSNTNHSAWWMNGNRRSPNGTLGFQCFQACHILDIVLGSIVMLYTGLVLLPQNRWSSICLMVLASLVILRGIVAKITRRGASMSAALSLALTGLYCLMALITYVGSRWTKSKPDECEFIPFEAWCHKINLTTIALTFFIWGIFELIRYLWIRQWMLEEASQVRDDLNASEVTYDRRRQQQRQPWWWQSSPHSRGADRTSTEPLLNENRRPHWSSTGSRGYHMDHGGEDRTPSAAVSRSWWLFPRRSSTNGSGVRDDGSVEYASLNEDWASRSQEDPFWWAQEEGGGHRN